MNDDCSMFVLGQNQTCEWIKAACYSSILSRPNADDIGYPLGARTMPPHLHDRADPDIPPRAPCAPASTNRVLSVTRYVQARRRRAAVKVRAASSRAVTVPPPLADP